MQIIALIMSFLFNKVNNKSLTLKESAMEIFEEIIHKSRNIVTLAMVGICAVVLFCGGFFIALYNATSQYDRAGGFTFTATFGGGLALVLIALASFFFAFFRAWPGAHKKKAKHRHEEREEGKPGELEHALSAFILDIVREREEKRRDKAAKHGPRREERMESRREEAWERERPTTGPH
ncbi:hypothetical protein QJS83_16125 [Bdellovibrio sp. 22V]|uniref:hypothetical protein n=1 Tax=Bdellovibrio TaxID=958 RepID=UPI002543609D|nr:hypothetical protein [Bdellovibrio sp. 22V]WII71991.1 hypothetical protein QJS83_16125 [Bdellovibrio sp. 22V]